MSCHLCANENAETAWGAARATRVAALVEESHCSLQITACSCGQRFINVFTERIDWNGGEDDQTWLTLAIAADEAARLEGTAEGELHRVVNALGVGRRFLVRSFPTGGVLSVWWQASGFSIGPHD
ncbi:MAG: hypothetical protein U0228_11390 [Myxococcaceae bacterium]